MRNRREFKYSRPVEQMGVAIVYGGIPEICRMMDDKELENAIEELKKLNVSEDEWDLIHYPNKSGLGGKFTLIWWKK